MSLPALPSRLLQSSAYAKETSSWVCDLWHACWDVSSPHPPYNAWATVHRITL